MPDSKALLGVHSAHLLLGDFVSWLEQDRRRFDVIWATGVLYHMTEPLPLLRLLADRTDRLYIWTMTIRQTAATAAYFD